MNLINSNNFIFYNFNYYSRPEFFMVIKTFKMIINSRLFNNIFVFYKLFYLTFKGFFIKFLEFFFLFIYFILLLYKIENKIN